MDAEKPSYTEQKKKLISVVNKPLDEQMEFFLHRFTYQLEKSGFIRILEVAEMFKEYANKSKQGGNSMGITSPMFGTFLKKQEINWTVLQRKEKTKEFDFNEDGEFSLLEYLMMQNKSLILTQFFLRNGYTQDDITPDLVEATGILNDNVLNITLNLTEALVMEMFEHPYGVDHVLDVALVEFTQIMRPRFQEMDDLEELTRSPSTSAVKKMQAAQELKKLREEVEQPLVNTQVRFAAAIKKLKQHQDKHFKEIYAAAQKEFEASKEYKGTVGGARRTYLEASKN